MRVAAGADGVRQQHAVQPAVNNAVARTQRYTATVHDEVRQGVVGFHVNRLRVGGGVTERLHHQIGREAEAGEVFQFVAGHRAGGVLGADGGHLRFAVHARAHAFQAAGLADHFLGQSEALAGVGRLLRQAEQGGGGQAEGFTGLGSEATADDQVDPAAGAHFVQNHVGLVLELGNHFAVFFHFARERIDVDHVAGVHVGDVTLERQGAGVFHGVEENRGDFAADADTAAALVRHIRDVVAEVPEHRVGGGFTA